MRELGRDRLADARVVRGQVDRHGPATTDAASALPALEVALRRDNRRDLRGVGEA